MRQENPKGRYDMVTISNRGGTTTDLLQRFRCRNQKMENIAERKV